MSSPGWFPPRINLEEFKWTREKATTVRVKTSFILQELVIPEEPNEAERELTRMMEALSIDRLLTPYEQYWACRYTGLLPPQPRDNLIGDKFQKFSDPVDDPLRAFRISDTRTGYPIFLDKKDGCEIAKLEPYITPFLRYREASRSSASVDQLAQTLDQWERDGSLVQRLRQFRDILSTFDASAMWCAWTSDEIATAFVVQYILRPDSIKYMTRQYLQAWGKVLRTTDTRALIYTEVQSGENVLMRGTKEPFSVGFRDTLWTRVRRAESVGDPTYDPYHRDLVAAADRREDEADWVEESESFRPFYMGKQSSDKCRPGAPGETLVNEKHLVEFSLMLVHLRLIELRNRVTNSLRARVLRQVSKWHDLCFPEPPMSFREWTMSLAPCLSKRFGRMFEELDALGDYAPLDSRLIWELNEALKTATQLYRANGWPVEYLIDTRPFSLLSASHKAEHRRKIKGDDTNDEIKTDRLTCHTIVGYNGCPFKSASANTPARCVEMCKQNIKVEDVEDLARKLGGNPRFPVVSNWNPHTASLLIVHSKRISKE